VQNALTCVTLAIGSFTRLSKYVSRADTFFAGATFTPSSPPTSRSGPRSLFGNVVTAPTENWRYSSVSVGARNAEFAAPHTLTRSDTWYSAPTRGLKTVSFLSAIVGRLFPVG
jgi:hypothetical protein